MKEVRFDGCPKALETNAKCPALTGGLGCSRCSTDARELKSKVDAGTGLSLEAVRNCMREYVCINVSICTCMSIGIHIYIYPSVYVYTHIRVYGCVVLHGSVNFGMHAVCTNR